MEERDAIKAEEIMRFALFRQVPKRQRRKKRKLNTGGARKKLDDAEGSDEEDETDSEEEEEAVAARMNIPPAAASSPPQVPADPIWGDDTTQDVTMVDEESQTTTAGAPTQAGRPREER